MLSFLTKVVRCYPLCSSYSVTLVDVGDHSCDGTIERVVWSVKKASSAFDGIFLSPDPAFLDGFSVRWLEEERFYVPYRRINKFPGDDCRARAWHSSSSDFAICARFLMVKCQWGILSRYLTTNVYVLSNNNYMYTCMFSYLLLILPHRNNSWFSPFLVLFFHHYCSLLDVRKAFEDSMHRGICSIISKKDWIALFQHGTILWRKELLKLLWSWVSDGYARKVGKAINSCDSERLRTAALSTKWGRNWNTKIGSVSSNMWFF